MTDSFGLGAGYTEEWFQWFEAEAKKVLDSAVDEVVGETGDIEIDRVVTEGAASRVLIEAAEDAELLVVGSRGRGGFAGLLLGSVSQQCAHHAPCPVVIVRGA